MKIFTLLLTFVQFAAITCGAMAEENASSEAFKYGTYNATAKFRNSEGLPSHVNDLPIEHKKYTPSQDELDKIDVLNYDEYSPKHHKATQAEIERLRKHYRHIALKEQVPQLSYIAFKYIYALPTVVNDYQNKVSGSTTIQKAAIDVFNTISAPNGNQLLLDQRSFGLGGSYGRQLSKSTSSELEVVFYQKTFTHTDSSTVGISISYDYTDSAGAPQVGTLKYSNVEYIQRNLALTYSRHIEFINFFGESSSEKISKLVPYITLGGGAISRWNFLRFSVGALGTTSSTVSDLTTDESIFSFMPAFVYGVGLRYKMTTYLSFDAQFKSIQPVNDINFQNYAIFTGLRIYF